MAQAWGQSPTGNDNPTGVAGDYGGSITTGGGYDPYTGNAKRVIDDIVVPGAVGAYPLKWTRFLNTRDGGSHQFGSSGVWSHNYAWGLAIYNAHPWQCCDQWEGPDGIISYPDGRRVNLWISDTAGEWDAYDSEGPKGMTNRVYDVGGGSYQLVMGDGGKVLFQTLSWWNGYYWQSDLFATTISDPYGLTTSLGYDYMGRLVQVTEPAGRYLLIYYGSAGIGTVQAWDGRGNLIESVNYGYTTAQVYWPAINTWMPYTDLTQVYYDDGAVATYTWRDSNVTDNTFSTTLNRMVETCDDPHYAGPMKRIKYEYVPHYGNPTGAWGQIRAERNATTDQVVSQVAYPAYPDASGNRYETRGDGPQRHISAGPFGWTDWTDYQSHTSYLNLFPPFDGWQFTDARYNTTSYERYAGTIGALWRITQPGDGSTREFIYSDMGNPFYVTGVKDENGHWKYFDRDGNNRVWQIRYPDGAYETFSYNQFGEVVDHRLTSGGVEHFDYDYRGLKYAYTDPFGNVTHYNYYWNDRLQNVVDPYGNATWFEYNQRGQVTKLTHQDGSYQASDYDAYGNKIWQEDELRHRTNFAYDEYGRVTSVTNPLNQTTTTSYALDWSNPLIHTTNNPKYTVSPMGKNVVFGYDENLRKSYQVQALSTPDEAWTWFGYDEVGNLSWTRDPRNNTTSFGYDQRNRRTSVTNALNQTTWCGYDGASNKRWETRADGTSRSWIQDTMNRMWIHYGFAGETTVWDHNYSGTISRITDAKGAVYSFAYDLLNRKTSQSYPPDTNGPGRSENFWYDAIGNLIQYKNPANQYKHLQYDNRNRLTDTTWDVPASNGPLIAFLANANNLYVTAENAGSSPLIANRSAIGLWEQFELINLGNGYVAFRSMVNGLYVCAENAGASPLVANRTAIGTWEQFRLVDVGGGFTALVARANGMYVCAESAGASSLIANRSAIGGWEQFRIMSLPSAAPPVHYNFDAAGRMTSVQTNGGETTVGFGYDDANRKVWEDQTLSGYPTRRVNTPRDADGNRLYLEVANYYHIDYGYTQRNQLASIGSVANFRYDTNGNLTNREGFWCYTNETNFTYDELNRVTQVEQGSANNWIFARSHYQYDAVGREAATWRDENNGAGPNKGEKFWYTANDQLAVAEYNADQVWTGNPANWDRWVGYSYSPDMLNRTSVNDNGNLLSFSVSPLNQYTVANNQATGYDGNFNLSSYNGATFSHDAQNRLLSATNGSNNAEFTYDGLGRCVRRTINGDTKLFTYDDWNPILEWDGAGNFRAWNIYGARADEILARWDNQIGPMIYKQDRHGNVIALLDGVGNIAERYTYDAFGKPKVTGFCDDNDRGGSWYGNRFMFTGREWFPELGIYDYRNRYYQPYLGRFLQVDPMNFAAGDMNLFRYCDDDPVDRSDPDGLYARGEGFTDDQWKKFDIAQQTAAARLEKASAQMDPKVFEKVFGKGSATAENMNRVQKIMQGMARALRDDGTKGYVANAFSSPKSSTLGVGNVNGNKISVNVAHPGFGIPVTLTQTVGHESGHNMGLDHVHGANAAYRYGTKAQREIYKNQSTPERLKNPDNYMEYAP